MSMKHKQVVHGRIPGNPSITETDWRALRLLSEQRDLANAQVGRLVSGHISDPNHPGPTRPAGKVLNRLKRIGLARWTSSPTRCGWEVTAEGRAALNRGGLPDRSNVVAKPRKAR